MVKELLSCCLKCKACCFVCIDVDVPLPETYNELLFTFHELLRGETRHLKYERIVDNCFGMIYPERSAC